MLLDPHRAALWTEKDQKAKLVVAEASRAAALRASMRAAVMLLIGSGRRTSENRSEHNYPLFDFFIDVFLLHYVNKHISVLLRASMRAAVMRRIGVWKEDERKSK